MADAYKPHPRWITMWLRLSTAKDEEYFFENLTMLLSSGIDIGTALASLEKSVQTGSMKSIVGYMRRDIDAGLALSHAIERQQLLPPHLIHLIRIGEESGRLDENFKVIVGQMQKNTTLKNKIYSALAYPLFVLMLTIVIGAGIAWFLLPNLASVFTRLNIALPATTQVLIFVGTFLGMYGYIAIPVCFVTIITITMLYFTFPPVKQIWQYFIFSLPGVHTVVAEAELTRFGFIVGTLLDAGLPFPQALNLLAESTDFNRYKRFYHMLQKKVEEGNTLTRSISGYPGNEHLIPIPFQQLISSAEASGHLAQTLKHIGDISEAKVDIAAKNLTVMLEPLLLLIVWLGVVWVAVSVILPIYRLIGSFNSATGF